MLNTHILTRISYCNLLNRLNNFGVPYLYLVVLYFRQSLTLSLQCYSKTQIKDIHPLFDQHNSDKFLKITGLQDTPKNGYKINNF